MPAVLALHEEAPTYGSTAHPHVDRPERLVEASLLAAWLLGRVPEAAVAPWRVLRFGRAGRGPGPDVREAAFVLPDGSILAGDVEVHLRGADWQAHGHGSDPAYANVILHLLWGASGPVSLPDGRLVRSVEVGAAFGGDVERLRAAVRLGPRGHEPCHLDERAGEEERAARRALAAREGQRRLAERAWRAGDLAARVGWDEAWRTLLDHALARSAGRRVEDAEQRAVIAAAIGLRLGPEAPGCLVALARCGRPGAVISALRGDVIGAGRAAEVGWNAALPLLAALASAYDDAGLARNVAALVAAWPAPRPYGRTLALASMVGVSPRRAVEAQGLLHTQELWCERGGCGGRCPFSPAAVASDDH